jgi:hypothetical protein
VLKGHYGCEAIAIGTFWFSAESTVVLAAWADFIMPVEGKDADLPQPDFGRWAHSPIWKSQYDAKRIIVNIGPDVWGHTDWDGIKAVAHGRLKEAMNV